MLYSTCTVNKIENAEVVSKFLRKHKKFELVRSRQLLPGVDETDGFFHLQDEKTRQLKGDLNGGWLQN